MSSPLRASNEGLLRPRVARAQGTHRAIPPSAGGLFQHPAKQDVEQPGSKSGRLVAEIWRYSVVAVAALMQQNTVWLCR